MSNFEGHAKSLSQLYVYYKRLNTDGYYPTLGEYAENASYRILGQTSKYAQDSSSVRAMAKAEFSKEKKLLSEKFGVNFGFGYYGEGGKKKADIKEVVDALNATLNLKDAYDRNKLLIQKTVGQKGVYSWYPTYFMKAWTEYWPSIKKSIDYRIGKNQDSAQLLAQVLDNYMPQVCIRGIELMFDGPELESKQLKQSPELKNAYKDLVEHIGNINQAGSVAQQIYKAYGLDEIKSNLVEQLTASITNSKAYARDFKPKVKNMISKDVHSRGGLTLEAVENAIFQSISVGKGGLTFHSGATEIKADNILTFEIDPSLIYQALEEAGKNRDENIKALSKLGDKLSKLEEGFIVYSSDKNYTLNKNFSGYSAGSLGANAQDFLYNVYKNSGSVSTLLGAINQLGKGAMLEGQEEAFERLLAQDVAYMLFDDYTTIGQQDAGGRSIHVMNLNGLMIPLSLILDLLADAIDDVDSASAVKRIVNVDIKAPNILFPTQESQNKWQEAHGQNPWEYQRQYVLDNTKITAKFLASFKQIVTQYL